MTNESDPLHVDDPVTVGKIRLIEALLGIFSHGLRIMALAPLLIALFASLLLTLTFTETHDEWLPKIMEPLPRSVQETLHDNEAGWDEIGKRLAAPLILAAFLFSLAVGLVEQLTGLRLRRYAPKLWHWLIGLFLIFGTFAGLTLRYKTTDESPVLIAFVIILLNACCLGMATLSVLGLWAVNRAETGSVAALHQRYGLVRVPSEPKGSAHGPR